MDFADKAVVALSNDATRLTVFGQAALKNIIKAAYGLDDAVLQGAAVPRFAAFTLGGLDPAADANPSFLPPPESRIDALWRGGIRVAASFPMARIEDVAYANLSLSGLDADVAAANGGAMPAGVALETARRAVLLTRLQALAAHPGSATPAAIDNWLEKSGASSVDDLLAAPGTASLSELQIAFSDPIGGVAFSQMDFPIAVAVLIRDPADPANRLTNMIAAARQIQAAMRKAGYEPKQPSEAGGQGKAVTALMVPDVWFDDTDWPGASRAARITAAGAWMALEGIGLVPSAL